MSSKSNTMSNFVNVEIIDDSSDEEIKDEREINHKPENDLNEVIEVIKKRVTKMETVNENVCQDKKKTVEGKKEKGKKEKGKKEKGKKENKKEESVVDPICLLKKFYYPEGTLEIGADEAGRGPMFGRVYSGAVILPKDDSFHHFKMKDSKKFTSKNPKKINEVAEYIKQHAIAWAVEYEDETVIDEINILQATQSAMHKAIKNVIAQLQKKTGGSIRK